MGLFNDKKMDAKLKIKTRGTRNSPDKDHYRYEATPYRGLNLLYKKIKLTENDHFVDFGSGKGRVCFYTHYLFNCNIYGVEANLSTYHEALLNLESYEKNNSKINFIYGFAEKYLISPKHNFFFFFNPFTVNIFKNVISNINKSLKQHFREVTIILAYPFPEFVNFILEHTSFNVKDYIESKDKKEGLNKFLILTNI